MTPKPKALCIAAFLLVLTQLCYADLRFELLASFDGTNGARPNCALVQRSGEFFGTTALGNNLGNIFKVTASKKVRPVLNFDYTNGAIPFAGLTLGPDGQLYGTTTEGGADLGTAFRYSPDGKLVTIASFQRTNGSWPNGLVLATDGNFYGTTSDEFTFGNGTVFRLTPAGAFTTLFAFNGVNGQEPLDDLTQGRDGFLYGSTLFGGTDGAGTVFKN